MREIVTPWRRKYAEQMAREAVRRAKFENELLMASLQKERAEIIWKESERNIAEQTAAVEMELKAAEVERIKSQLRAETGNGQEELITQLKVLALQIVDRYAPPGLGEEEKMKHVAKLLPQLPNLIFTCTEIETEYSIRVISK